jgi:catechol 2,3-dioxygenase-like lactoylglutathione lyase family enzyme
MEESISKPERKFAQPLDSAWKIIPCLESQDVRTALRFYTEVLGFKGHSLRTRAPSPPPSSAAPEAQSESRSSLPSRSSPEAPADGSADARSKQGSATVERSSSGPMAAAAETPDISAKAAAGGAPGEAEPAFSAPAAASHQQATRNNAPHGAGPQPQAIATTASATSAASEAHVSLSHAAPDPEPDFCSIYAGNRAAANLYIFLNSPSQPVTASWALVALSTAELERLWQKLSAMRHDGAARSSFSENGVWKVAIVEEIGDRPWGYRQFSVRDADENKISFFSFLDGGSPVDSVDDAE